MPKIIRTAYIPENPDNLGTPGFHVTTVDGDYMIAVHEDQLFGRYAYVGKVTKADYDPDSRLGPHNWWGLYKTSNLYKLHGGIIEALSLIRRLNRNNELLVTPFPLNFFDPSTLSSPEDDNEG